MNEADLDNTAAEILDEMVHYEGRELKGFRRTIADDVRDLLIESNINFQLTNTPVITVIMVTNMHTSDPCSSCYENFSNITKWVAARNLEDKVRLLLVDASEGLDDRKLWAKLKTSFEDVPLTYFFNESRCLLDVIQGAMSTDYLDMFWLPYVE